jgi:hypothetical protein
MPGVARGYLRGIRRVPDGLIGKKEYRGILRSENTPQGRRGNL